jgi:hypothetical protein
MSALQDRTNLGIGTLAAVWRLNGAMLRAP